MADKKQSNEAQRKEALRLAGIMADAAIALVGGEGLNGHVLPCSISHMSVLADRLRRAVHEYNDHMIAWTTERECAKCDDPKDCHPDCPHRVRS